MNNLFEENKIYVISANILRKKLNKRRKTIRPVFYKTFIVCQNGKILTDVMLKGNKMAFSDQMMWLNNIGTTGRIFLKDEKIVLPEKPNFWLLDKYFSIYVFANSPFLSAEDKTKWNYESLEDFDDRYTIFQNYFERFVFDCEVIVTVEDDVEIRQNDNIQECFTKAVNLINERYPNRFKEEMLECDLIKNHISEVHEILCEKEFLSTKLESLLLSNRESVSGGISFSNQCKLIDYQLYFLSEFLIKRLKSFSTNIDEKLHDSDF